MTVREGAGLNQAAARSDRRSKDYDRAVMRERAMRLEAEHGDQARRVHEQSIARGANFYDQGFVAKRAQESVTFARENAVEREAVADMRRVMTDALRRNMSLTTFGAVRAELAAREARGEFIGIIGEHQPRRATTERMLRMERENLQRIADGRDALPPVVKENEASQVVRQSAERQGIALNAGQRAAVAQLVRSSDRITGLQGGAGTGKTTTLAVLHNVAEDAGYEMRGLAPTTRAAEQLARSGIETETLQKFVSRRHEPLGNDKRVLYVLDESSLASTRNLHQFFARIGAEDRVLMVGDARQHQAVEAGSPFEQFQQAGMQTAHLTEIVRQRDANLKRTVERLSARDIKSAVEQLQADGRVVEAPNENERLRRIASDYCERPEGALVISPANRERMELNRLIHEGLRAEGRIVSDDFTTKVYVPRQEMTGAERTFAGAYLPNEDVIRYSRASKVYGIKAGDYARVVETDRRENTITVRTEAGREVTYNPARLSGGSVYREDERRFAVGDRIQFRAPFPEGRIANGALGTVERIEGERLSVTLDEGRNISFDAGAFRHLDYGYAVTSHSSQGCTVDRVIVHADTRESDALLNQRMGYVALSRARQDATIYTDSAEGLGRALDRSVDKQSAIEAMRGAMPDGQGKSIAGIGQNLSTRDAAAGQGEKAAVEYAAGEHALELGIGL